MTRAETTCLPIGPKRKRGRRLPGAGRFAFAAVPAKDCSIMSRIAKSGLWTLSHSSADSHERKDPPTEGQHPSLYLRNTKR